MICIVYTLFFCLFAEATMSSLWVFFSFMQLSGYPICLVCPWRLDFTIQGGIWLEMETYWLVPRRGVAWCRYASVAFGRERALYIAFINFPRTVKAINPLSWKWCEIASNISSDFRCSPWGLPHPPRTINGTQGVTHNTLQTTPSWALGERKKELGFCEINNQCTCSLNVCVAFSKNDGSRIFKHAAQEVSSHPRRQGSNRYTMT